MTKRTQWIVLIGIVAVAVASVVGFVYLVWPRPLIEDPEVTYIYLNYHIARKIVEDPADQQEIVNYLNSLKRDQCPEDTLANSGTKSMEILFKDGTRDALFFSKLPKGIEFLVYVDHSGERTAYRVPEGSQKWLDDLYDEYDSIEYNRYYKNEPLPAD